MMLQCHRVAIECHWSSVYIHKTDKQHCGRVYQFIFISFIFYEKHVAMGITARNKTPNDQLFPRAAESKPDDQQLP